jgi:hypothetical protein
MPNKASGQSALEAHDARVGLEYGGKGLCTLGTEVVVANAASTSTPIVSAAHMLTRSMLGAANMPNKASGEGLGHCEGLEASPSASDTDCM